MPCSFYILVLSACELNCFGQSSLFFLSFGCAFFLILEKKGSLAGVPFPAVATPVLAGEHVYHGLPQICALVYITIIYHSATFTKVYCLKATRFVFAFRVATSSVPADIVCSELPVQLLPIFGVCCVVMDHGWLPYPSSVPPLSTLGT